MTDPRELMSGYFDGGLTEAESADLREWVQADPGNLRTFAREALLHSHMRDLLAGKELVGQAESKTAAVTLDATEATGGARSTGGLGQRPPAVGRQSAQWWASAGRRRSPRTLKLVHWLKEDRRRIAAAIMGLAACMAVVFYLTHGQPAHRPELATTRHAPSFEPAQITQVAEISAVAGAVWEQGDALGSGSGASLDVGTQLPPHRLLRLHSGGAEILFNSGARVVLEGPADFRLDGPNRGSLAFGKLVAHVPPPAHGFAIATPSALVTDHGTVFGVNVSDTGAALVHMYEGSADVAVVATDAQSQPSPVLLHAGNVIAQDVAGGLAWIDVTDPKAFPDTFALELRELRLPLPLHSTGVGLAVGAADPNWQIISTPSGSKFEHGTAIVTRPLARLWLENAPQRSQWVSIGADAPNTKDGDYTFRTSVDLSGFDPKTVRIRANIIVDDEVKDVLINGKSSGIRLRLDQRLMDYRSFHAFTIDRDFSRGINQIDVVVWNRLIPNPRSPENPVGLRVEWEGDAVPETESR